MHLLPSPTQLLAHFTLTHDIFEFSALSAGAWYVAIDFQLFLMTIGLVWMIRKRTTHIQTAKATMLVAMGIAALTILALFWWNRNPEVDEWGWYFFGSYGLGFLAHWAGRQRHSGPFTIAVVLCLAACLALQWRERLLLTGLVAIRLAYTELIEQHISRLAVAPIRWLSKISYSVFLIHYGIAVLASAIVIEMNIHGLAADATAFLLTWMAGITGGWLLYREVESRG